MDDKDEIEEVRKMITSSGKEQNETGSTNRLDKDGELETIPRTMSLIAWVRVIL